MCTEPTDMRKSFDGLAALTKSVLGQNPLSGHLFVFVNRRGNYAKCLYYDHGGFCLWAKRLERGTFAPVTLEQARRGLTDTQLRMWIDGIALTERHQRKRFVLPEGVRTPA
ncbi:MAG: IS66 family insertion sequence element accessory protein TnpB [Burkholderiaceae bacterium]